MCKVQPGMQRLLEVEGEVMSDLISRQAAIDALDMKKLKLEEAITILQDMKVDIPLPKAAVMQTKRNIALDMAIDALKCSEMPNSSQCISRQAAIDKMIWYDDEEYMHPGFIKTEHAIKILEGLPSVQQEQKVGEWQITDAYPHNVYCSVCHKRFAQTHWAVWEDGSLPRNYCPNCGAKMERR